MKNSSGNGGGAIKLYLEREDTPVEATADAYFLGDNVAFNVAVHCQDQAPDMDSPQNHTMDVHLPLGIEAALNNDAFS
jgi:hypothetical protein